MRKVFDLFVERYLMLLNPAVVRGLRHQLGEGKTPENAVDQARTLSGSFDFNRKMATVEFPRI